MKRLSFLQPQGVLAPGLVSDALALVSLDVSPAEMEHWSDLDLLVVYDWAAREHLHAADAPIRRRPRPGLLAGARPFKIEIPQIGRKRGTRSGVRSV